MTRVVNCVVLNREAEGLETPPCPGRIFQSVSKEGWGQWLERLTMIINENSLNTGDPRNLELIEQHMLGFLFKEGDSGGIPQGFQPPGVKK